MNPVLREQILKHENSYCLDIKRDLAGRSTAGRKGLRMRRSETLGMEDVGLSQAPSALAALAF